MFFLSWSVSCRFLMCKHTPFACICKTCVCSAWRSQKKVPDSPGTGISRRLWADMWVLAINPNPLEKQPGLWTPEPPPQPPPTFLNTVSLHTPGSHLGIPQKTHSSDAIQPCHRLASCFTSSSSCSQQRWDAANTNGPELVICRFDFSGTCPGFSQDRNLQTVLSVYNMP